MKRITYPIQAVSRLTGISIDTLRAWERRYVAIKPARNERGRVYEEAHVQRLLLLRDAVESGHAISKVAALSDKDLTQIRDRAATLRSIPARSGKPHPPTPAPPLNTLLQAIDRFDFLEFDHELNRLAAAMQPRGFVFDVVVPLMNAVGEEWYRGKLSVAQEHAVSGALRNMLGSMVRLYTGRQSGTTLLFATPNGERHEFGILCSAMLSAGRGFSTLYLGADLPSAEIIEAARKTETGTVVLGVKAAVPSKDSLKELRRISEQLPSSTELWIGGVRSSELLRAIGRTRAKHLRDLDAFEQEIDRLERGDA